MFGIVIFGAGSLLRCCIRLYRLPRTVQDSTLYNEMGAFGDRRFHSFIFILTRRDFNGAHQAMLIQTEFNWVSRVRKMTGDWPVDARTTVPLLMKPRDLCIAALISRSLHINSAGSSSVNPCQALNDNVKRRCGDSAFLRVWVWGNESRIP